MRADAGAFRAEILFLERLPLGRGGQGKLPFAKNPTWKRERAHEYIYRSMRVFPPILLLTAVLIFSFFPSFSLSFFPSFSLSFFPSFSLSFSFSWQRGSSRTTRGNLAAPPPPPPSSSSSPSPSRPFSSRVSKHGSKEREL